MAADKPWIMPLLSVQGAAQAIAFYKQAIGAEEQTRITSPDGHVVAHLLVGSTPLMVADESPEHGNHSPAALHGTTVRLALVTVDPDAAFARALAAGASVVYPVADQEYGWRLGCLQDPYGHRWDIGMPLPRPPARM